MKNPIRELIRVLDEEDTPTPMFFWAAFLLAAIVFGVALACGFIVGWLWQAHWLLGAFAIVLPLVGIYKEVTRAPTHLDR